MTFTCVKCGGSYQDEKDGVVDAEQNTFTCWRCIFWADVPEEQRKFLEDPALLFRIKCELDKVVVGEDKNKLLLYLIAASSYVKTYGAAWNLSAIITGSSSAGKSWLMNNVLSLFGNVEEFTRITGASPDRLNQDFTNKILKVEELKGTESAQTTLRVWISEGKLRLLTTDRDEKGRIIIKTIETKGCPTFVTTATEVEIDSELLNRIFILSMNESEQQTRQILMFEAKMYRELGVSNGYEPSSALKDLPLNLQKITYVVIPYAELLAEKFPIPKGRELSVGPRRDFKKLIFLIGVIAWLHQMQRMIVRRGPYFFVVADVADFYMAWRLSDEALINTILKLSERHKLVLNCFQNPGDTLTVREVAAKTDLSENRAREILNSLVKKGFLSKDESQRVHTYTLREKIEIDSTIEEFVTSISRFQETELENWLASQNYIFLLTRRGDDKIVDPLTGETFEAPAPTRANRIITKMLKKEDLSLKLYLEPPKTTNSPIVTISTDSTPRFVMIPADKYPFAFCEQCGGRPVEYEEVKPGEKEPHLYCANCGWKIMQQYGGN